MIVVTGATGFVGSAVVLKLLDKGFEVRVLCRPGSEQSNLKGLDVEVFEGDLLDPSSFSSLLKGCKGLFHIAADYRLWTRNPNKLFEINYCGTKSLILAAAMAGVPKIVYTSSVATLGIIDGGNGDETTPVNYRDMIGVYKQSKFYAEELVRNLVFSEKIPIVIVNPSTPIGPRDIKPTPTGRLILEASLGKVPAFVNTGLNVVHVDDVAVGHLLAFERGVIGERYILGGENIELIDILAKVAKITGRNPPKIKLPHNLILPLGYISEAWTYIVGGSSPFVTVDGIKMSKKKMFFSSEKAMHKLGYKPRLTSSAIADAISWFDQMGRLRK